MILKENQGHDQIIITKSVYGIEENEQLKLATYDPCCHEKYALIDWDKYIQEG